MKTLRAALLVTFVAWAPSAVAAPPYNIDDIVRQSSDKDLRRPPILYFAAAEKAGAPGSEFYRMENAENIFTSTKHSRNGNTAPGPLGGQHSYLFLAVEGYATGQPGISSDGREGALAYANLTDASTSKPNTAMAYGFSVYLPSELYSHGADHPPWAAAQPLYDDRIFKLTSTTLPWVPVLEISANRHQFTITYRGGKFNIGTVSTPLNPTAETTPTPDLCDQASQTDPAPYNHTRVAMPGVGSPAMGESTADVWHDFVVVYKASSSGADGSIVVWHRTAGTGPSGWVEWLRTPTPNSNSVPPIKVRTAFYESAAAIATGTVAAWGYERPSYCYGNGDIVPGCGGGSGNDCEFADVAPHQPDSGLYIDNIVVGSTVSAVQAAFPPYETGF